MQAAQFLDDANPIDGEGGDDDDDMWDGWGEEAPTQGKSAAEDLAAELEVCFAAIASPAPTVHRESKGKHNQKDKDKENEKEMAVKSNNKKSSKNDKMGEKGPDTGCKPLSSRAQQQQRRKEMKALKYEREKAKKQETLNLKLEQSIAVGEGVGEEVYEEVCSGEDGEGEGESEEEIDEEDENNRSPVYDDAAAIERRILGETLLKEILERYKTPSTASVPTPNTATFRAVDLSSDPRLSELLGALSSSQQCCQKLWAPKKTSENAYTKVSVRIVIMIEFTQYLFSVLFLVFFSVLYLVEDFF